MKLNQIIAIMKGLKSRVYASVTEMHKASQKAELFNGFHKKYTPLNAEDTKVFPPEGKKVQQVAEVLLKDAFRLWTELFDGMVTLDEGNRHAVADIVIDGTTLAQAVPVTTLIALEKQVEDIRKFVDTLPVLDPEEDWLLDPAQGFYRTEPVKRHREEKLPRVIVKYPATTEHPAQTEIYMDTQIVGIWDTTKFSGAIPAPRKAQLLERVEKLAAALKSAREEANGIEIERKQLGQALFRFLLEPLEDRGGRSH